MRHGHLAGVTIACSLIGLAVTANSQGPGQKLALLVGVRQYDLSELRSLPYSEPDVVELAEVLKGAGYKQIVTLAPTGGAGKFRPLPTATIIRIILNGMSRIAGQMTRLWSPSPDTGPVQRLARQLLVSDGRPAGQSTLLVPPPVVQTPGRDRAARHSFRGEDRWPTPTNC